LILFISVLNLSSIEIDQCFTLVIDYIVQVY
jgi:hypothetical protein